MMQHCGDMCSQDRLIESAMNSGQDCRSAMYHCYPIVYLQHQGSYAGVKWSDGFHSLYALIVLF
jgi:hypothetical protein